ncbi:MAG: hypothetical protein JWN83_2200 [Chitinophagaceae bacterium]|nr:hypothetical protein [Chitinophagaceae bacterium]
MELKPGDSIPVSYLMDALEKDRQHIYNTTLFVEVVVEPVLINAFDFDINVTVKERWYIFPLPELKFVDGSLNKWIMHYKGDISRVNYGIKFLHNNLTGRKDQLGIHLLNGYTKTISFNYKAPYSNSALTHGFSVGGGYLQSREVAYKTSYDNEFLYYKRDHFVKAEWDIQLGYSIRRGLKLSHSFSLNYTHLHINDSIISANYNQAYFNKPVSKIGYVDFYYTLRYTDVNNILYPLTGFSGSIGMSKRGLDFSGGISSFSIDAEYNKYWSLGRKWYASTQIQGNIKLPFNQAYINQQALGYGNNYVRGLEYKIIDGVAYAISKFNLKREIFNFSINTIFKKSKTFNKIPFRIYAKTFADMGYCYNREDFASALNNKFLGSTGIGIDIVTFYDIQIRMEYSVNQLGQKGLFLHNEKGF